MPHAALGLMILEYAVSLAAAMAFYRLIEGRVPRETRGGIGKHAAGANATCTAGATGSRTASINGPASADFAWNRAAYTSSLMTWASTSGCGRPTGSTTWRHGRVDADVAIQRGDYFLEMDRSLGGEFAQPIRGTDHLAGLHAAAGEKARLTFGQWSRPAPVLIFGVRPNSPQATTVVSSSMSRAARSSINALRH